MTWVWMTVAYMDGREQNFLPSVTGVFYIKLLLAH